MLQRLISDIELQRAALLLIPIALWIYLFLSRKYSIREHSGTFLSVIWQFQATLVLNIFLSSFWHFETIKHLFYGAPIDVLLGQAVLLGAVNFLIFRGLSFVFKSIFALFVLCCIYKFSSFIVPHPQWWIGVLALMLISVVPSLLLAEWTADDQHIYLRSTLQTLSWVSLLLWLFPSIVLENTGHTWQTFIGRSLEERVLYLLPLILPGAILLSALTQFAIEGDGTAFPYDPPKKLVTKGIYAYLSNPMQVGICLTMAWWGVVIGSMWISLSAAVAVFLFVVFKDICNGSCAIGEQDPNWAIYQKEVPKWIPRMTPWR